MRKVLRHFDADMKGVFLIRELSNKTPIHRSASHIDLQCPICGIMFSRKASEANRHENNYCGRGCASFAQRIQVDVYCRVCGKHFTVKKSMFGHITCCGPECRIKAISESTHFTDIMMWENGKFQRGEKHPAAKLKQCQVVSIRADERLHSVIAADYGVTRALISSIKRCEIWRENL